MTETMPAEPRSGVAHDETALEIRRLEAPVEAGFTSMTFPIYRRLLAFEPTSRHPEQGDQRLVQPLGLAAWRGGEPAGLILGELPVEGEPAPGSCRSEDDLEARSAHVLSLFVKAPQRREGIGGALVAALEDEVRQLGYPALATVYTAGKPEIEYLERILERRDWASPRPRTVSVRFTPEAAYASDVLDARRLRILGRGLEIFPWSELGDEERELMQSSHAENPWIAPELVPWRFDQTFDPSSVGARYRGRVVGWVITHRIDADKVRFTCSFMRKDLSRRGRIVPLYAAVLERLRPTACRLCTFVTPYSYTGMVEFIRRRLVPISTFVGETRETCKHFPYLPPVSS